MIKYANLIDDYIYKNIPTNVLQGMKLKIENELMERTLMSLPERTANDEICTYK